MFAYIVVEFSCFGISLGLYSLAAVSLVRQFVDFGTDSTFGLGGVLSDNEMVRIVVPVNVYIIDWSRAEVGSIVLIMLSTPHSAVGVLDAFDVSLSSHLSLFAGIQLLRLSGINLFASADAVVGLRVIGTSVKLLTVRKGEHRLF
jgi:hypothetical protein